MLDHNKIYTPIRYLLMKSSATQSKAGTAALAASGAARAFDTLDLNLDHGSPCLE